MTVKNKHGRKGVKKYIPNRPLAENQKNEIAEKYHASGYKSGVKDALRDALTTVNGARTIRDARRRIEEMVSAQA